MTSLTANTIVILALLALLTYGKHDDAIERAVADIVPNEETLPDGAPDNVQGTITLRTSDSFECDSSDSTDSIDSIDSIHATLIVGDITGLEPGQIYDLHIHTSGVIYNDLIVDCNLAGITPDDHFNPASLLDNHQFGPHMGDLPRIIADEDGNGRIQIMAQEIKLNGVNSVIGRAFIIDLIGPHLQVACGVIVATTDDSPSVDESSEPKSTDSSSSSDTDDDAKQRSNAMLKALGNNAFYGETGLLTVEAFITGFIWILVAILMFCTVFCYCVITRRAKKDTQFMIDTIEASA